MAQLADAVVARGGKLLEGTGVNGMHDGKTGVTLTYSDGGNEQFQAVVLATGAWLGDLAAQFGVRRVVQAGRGYSFSVAGEDVPTNPIYFPSQRVACTPMDSADGRRLRVAGMMEFRSPDAPLDIRRVNAIADTVRPLLHGRDFDARGEEWGGFATLHRRRAAADRLHQL